MDNLNIITENAELELNSQVYSNNPLGDRETDLYRGEYIMSFVEKWDELIDWTARGESEGQFFIDVLRARARTPSSTLRAAQDFTPYVCEMQVSMSPRRTVPLRC